MRKGEADETSDGLAGTGRGAVRVVAGAGGSDQCTSVLALAEEDGRGEARWRLMAKPCERVGGRRAWWWVLGSGEKRSAEEAWRSVETVGERGGGGGAGGGSSLARLGWPCTHAGRCHPASARWGGDGWRPGCGGRLRRRGG